MVLCERSWGQVQGDRKWLEHESPKQEAGQLPLAAFELGLDPGEANDLLGQAAWVEKLNANARVQRACLLQSLFVQGQSEDSLEMDAAMRALGYMGEEQ